jgi:hypothetical protein
LSCAPASRAQETQPANDGDLPWIDQVRSQVRDATSTLAGELDAFLSDREYEAGLNETRLALRFGVDFSSDGDASPILEPRLRLSLPYTENRLFLDIFGFDRAREDEVTPSGGLLPDDVGESIDAVQLRLGTTYRGLELAPAIGLRFDESRPSAYAGLRIGAARQLGSGLALSGSQRLLLDSDRWLEAVTLLRADWLMDDRSLLRAQFVFDWRRDEAGARHEPSLIYRRFLDDRTAISVENTLSLYTAGWEKPDQIETALRLRRQLRNDWLFAELKPWLSFETGSAADRTYGLELSMDVTF